MRTIPFSNSDPGLLDVVNSLVMASASGDLELAPIRTAADAIEFLNVEMPDLAFINFSDPAIDGFALLDEILEDPWLHYAGIIGFCDDPDVSERLEKTRGINLIVSLDHGDIERYLPKVLGLIFRNQHILFQRGFSTDLVHTLTGSFELHNDTIEANCYANLLCNFLYNTDRIDGNGKRNIHIALVEMLINAIEHGNCGITYEEKTAWLMDGELMRDLIARKCADPRVETRRVRLDYTIAPTSSTFSITDEGSGFDWRTIQDPARAENVEALHGRGISMTRKFTRNLSYNDRGNQVTFEIIHQADCVNARPGLFERIPPVAVGAGDIVFHERETGDFLYYIARGEFDVIVGDRIVSTLSPNDILMGEMAFLLNKQRTATIRATTPGVLIRMSKKDFVEAIKSKPHYGLFLARLLAQRLQAHHAKSMQAEA